MKYVTYILPAALLCAAACGGDGPIQYRAAGAAEDRPDDPAGAPPGSGQEDTPLPELISPPAEEEPAPVEEPPDPEEDPPEPVEEPPDAGQAHRFVLIEDMTEEVSGPHPGVDIDAVVLLRADGQRRVATAVEDIYVVDEEGRNQATDPRAALGEPDDRCEANPGRFVSLGGRGGYLVVSFGTVEEDVAAFNGDAILVYEVSQRGCPGRDYLDDAFQVSVSISRDAGFVELGPVQAGEAAVPVRGLP